MAVAPASFDGIRPRDCLATWQPKDLDGHDAPAGMSHGKRIKQPHRNGFVTKTQERVVGTEERLTSVRFKLAGQHALGD
jgi:hypothetical protein